MFTQERRIGLLTEKQAGIHCLFVHTLNVLNILRMQMNRLPMKSYKMLYDKHYNTKKQLGLLHLPYIVQKWFWTRLGEPGRLWCKTLLVISKDWMVILIPRIVTLFSLTLNKHTDYLNTYCRSKKKPDKIESWSFRPKIASSTFLKNKTGNLWLSFLQRYVWIRTTLLVRMSKYSALRKTYITAKF